MTVDLSLCAREPIHIPGAIQPHGALLVTTPDSSRITHASDNLHDFLSCRAADVLGKPLAFALGADVPLDLLGNTTSFGPMPHHHFSILGRNQARLQLRVFRTGAHLAIDIERIGEDSSQTLQLTRAQAVLNSFHQARTVGELCDLAVRGLRSLTGYDRVMVYRFAAEGHGEVIAESRAAGMEAYLGQWYPASDIPEQARRLYLRQRVGVIVDASYQPVALRVDPEVDDHSPVDLTHSALRSVSPVHREFMRNMNTVASMTIGLESTGHGQTRELWGMIVCHHRTPRLAGIEVRASADLVGQMLSLLIASQTSQEIVAEQLERQATLVRLLALPADTDSMATALSAVGSDVLHLVNATGAVIQLQGERVCLGTTPDEPVVDALMALMRTESTTHVLAVDDLGARDPLFVSCASICSGALLLPLWKDTDNVIVWIRPERAQTVIWGGNPAKPAHAEAVTGRISPRASFKAWKEVVLGRSLPWSAADISLATELGGGIESQLARRTQLVRDLLGRIFGSSPVALMLIDHRGRINMLNHEAERIFGYAHDELLGCPLEQLVPARFRSQHVVHRAEYVEKPSLRKMGKTAELFGLRKNGVEFPVEITLNPVTPQNAAGEPLIQASLTDLTARRASERATRLAQERLHSIATHVPAMIGYWTRDLVCEFANDAYREWLECGTKRVVGMSMPDLLGPHRYAQIDIHVRAVLAGQSPHFETKVERPDGTITYSDSRYLPDIDERGTVRGFYILVTDVSSLEEARLALEESNAALTHTNRELDQFVYTASHDLRSPLRAICSLAQFVLEDDLTLQRETGERLRLIISRSQRMQKMLDQILEYARAGQDVEGDAPVKVAEVIDDVVATLGIPREFSIVKDASLDAIWVYPMPIAQVLQNLIGNALKHHDTTRGTVTVSVERDTSGLRFWVADDGPGIPLVYQESVFEMFTTLKRRDEVEASGMGLALVRKLVKLQGGQCGIESPEGRGVRIWFDWPLCPQEEGPHA